ncbi:hypothetical protein ACIOMM_32510 [Streptomyces sp. NPDC087908]|uniref:hypothetical protein n=1 Tax=Streptomyces sp. NPDC087908 TaxID=3365820 RepID=UPI00381F00B7
MMTIKVYRAGAPQTPVRQYAVEGLEEIPATNAYPPCRCPLPACRERTGPATTPEPGQR